MESSLLGRRVGLRLVAVLQDGSKPTVSQVANFLGDIALLHDLVVLATYEPYERSGAPKHLRRDRRRPQLDERLIAEHIELGSPLSSLLSVPPEQYVQLLLVVLLFRYGDAFVRSLGQRHGQIQADPLGEEIREAELDRLREETRALRLDNLKRSRAIAVDAQVTIDGKPALPQDLEGQLPDAALRLTAQPVHEQLTKVLRRLERDRWQVTEIDIGVDVSDEVDDPKGGVTPQP